MMERLGAPQTHLGLKKMIQEVDEDQDGKISFKEVGAGDSAIEYFFFNSKNNVVVMIW